MDCAPRMIAAARGLTPETSSVRTSTAVVIQAAKRGPRTSTCPGVLGFDMRLLLNCSMHDFGGGAPGGSGCSERGAKRRAYSAATTTAAARDAAQINCAATGEHELDAGGHVLQLTQWRCHQANSGVSAERRSSAFGTPAVR